jgi:hypothetical protein
MRYFFLSIICLVIFSCSTPEQKIISTIQDAQFGDSIDLNVRLFIAELEEDFFFYSTDSNALITVDRIKIFDYVKRRKTDSSRENYFSDTKFEELYTFNPKNWASGCVSLNNEPYNLITGLIRSKDHIALLVG